jgi:serine/threonine protein kinase
MRIFDKNKTIRQKDEQFVINLSDIANKLYHSLIAKQYRVFSDKYRVYIISKWVEGEDLFDLLTKTKKLSVSVVKHFAACVINIM